MIIGRASLYQKLQTNVCDLKFIRRIPKAGKPPYRRMLCTNNSVLLNSVNGKVILNFNSPSNPPEYNTASENVIVTWDIIMQDWRTINCNSVDLLVDYNENEFWDFYNKTLSKLTTSEKIIFMQS
jgi:hypothetical protein